MKRDTKAGRTGTGFGTRGYERWGARFPRAGTLAVAVAVAGGISGCSGGKDGWDGFGESDKSVRDARRDMQPSRGASGSANDRPAAILGNESVSWGDLSKGLSEAAGAAVLEEVCLDRLAAQEMKNRGLELDAGAIDREEALLGEALATSAGVTSDQSGDVIAQVRRARGLGEIRYASLLRRNAMMRRLVRDEVQVTPEDLQQAYDIRYGQRYQTRVIVTRSEREAAEALARVQAGERFADVATALSVDTSRLRGGAIGAVSPMDPSFPLSMRRAITAAAPGVPSPVIATEQTYAVVLVEHVVPPTGESMGSVSAGLEREIRAVRERAAMDRLAAQLLRSTKITVLDPSLDWSWRAREQR